MQVKPYLFDWGHATSALAKNEFESEINNAFDLLEESTITAIDASLEIREHPDSWLSRLNFSNDSHSYFINTCAAWQLIAGHLGKAGVRFNVVNGMFTFDAYINELKDTSDFFAISIGPESLKAIRLKSQDILEVKTIFEKRVSDDIKGGFRFTEKEHSFDDGFCPYVQMWINAMLFAAKKRKGFGVLLG